MAEIYGARYLPKELFLYSSTTRGEWTDVVTGEWIEGVTLRDATLQAALAGDTPQLERLAYAFDREAKKLVSDDWAHGDLKPENIIVDPGGRLHLIDLDAMYLPAFAGETSGELGTAAYQHPARTIRDFDSSLDDFPAALISTALHALALDPQLFERNKEMDGLLFTPQKIATDPVLKEVIHLFERKGYPIQYRIAKLLYSPTLKLFGLAQLLDWTLQETADRTTECSETKAPADDSAKSMLSSGVSGDSVVSALERELLQPLCFTNSAAQSANTPELFVENGLWGYRTPERITIPPVFDNGFDFTEGLAAVRIGDSWSYIDPEGRVRIRCEAYEAVKPFRNGRATVMRNGVKMEIDHKGDEFEI